MTNKSTFKVLATVTALSLAITACGGGSKPAETGGSTATPAKKEISFTIGYANGDPATRQAMVDSIDAFTKANPHIKIKNISETTTASYLDWLKTKDAVGEFPDLVEMRDTQLFADSGKLAELPAELHALFDNPPQVNGKIYTAPINLQPMQGIIYSKKAYADAGITAEPKTYDEFLAIQEKLKAKGASPIVVGGKDIFHWGFWINKFLIDEVFIKNPNWNSQRSQGKVSFTDEGPMKAMQDFTDLFTKGYVDKGYLSTADNQTASMLVTGKAAQLFSGPWMFPQIEQADPKFEFGFYAVPDRQGNVNIVGLPTPQGWAISSEAGKNADKLEAMKQFVQFFFAKDQYSKFLKATNFLPTTKEKITYEASPQQKKVLEIVNDPKTKKSLHINTFWGDNQIPPQFRNWFYKLAQEWLVKGDFSKEYMKKADEEWDNEIKALKK